jgi:hypothetical protein
MSGKSEFERENAGEVSFEQSLAGIVPRPPQVDRDRLMFLAGTAAARGQESGVRGQEQLVIANRGAWLWPATAAALGATSLALAVALVVQSSSPPQVVYIERPAPEAAPHAMRPQIVKTDETPHPDSVATNTTDAPRPAPRAVAAPHVPADNYLRSREVALRMGVDALGSRRSAAGDSTPPLTYLEWLSGFGSATSIAQPGESPDGSLPQM